MREIKFRVWDKLNQQMNDVYSLYWGHDRTRGIWNHEMWGSSSDNIILMQFTGLKDKNGKEIYESDIFESDDYGPFVVEWDSKTASWYMRDPLFDDIDSMDADAHFSMEISGSGSVIGNIYENPELLGKENEE